MFFRERENRWDLSFGFWLPMHIAPVPEPIIVPVCQGVPFPLHLFIQMKRQRGRESKRPRGGSRGFFPSGERKHKILLKKGYFSPLRGHKEKKQNKYISNLIEIDEKSNSFVLYMNDCMLTMNKMFYDKDIY